MIALLIATAASAPIKRVGIIVIAILSSVEVICQFDPSGAAKSFGIIFFSSTADADNDAPLPSSSSSSKSTIR